MSATGVAPLTAELLPRARELRMLRPVVPWLRAGAIGFGCVLIGLGLRPVGALWLLVGSGLLVGFFVWRLLASEATLTELRAGVAVEPIVGAATVLLTGAGPLPSGSTSRSRP